MFGNESALSWVVSTVAHFWPGRIARGDEGKSCLTILSNTLFHSVTAVLGRG